MKNSVDPDSRKSSHIIKRQSNYDMEEIHYIHVEQRKFLILALRHYLRGLKTSSEHDLLIFRAVRSISLHFYQVISRNRDIAFNIFI